MGWGGRGGGEDLKFLTGFVKIPGIRCFCYNHGIYDCACNQIALQSMSWLKIIHFIMTRFTTAACNHCGAPMPRRKATTSLLLLSMAIFRAVLPSLQASEWLRFNENREQRWQRPHLSLAAKSAFDETSSLQISRWPFQAERINAVLPLGEEMELRKVGNENKTNFG